MNGLAALIVVAVLFGTVWLGAGVAGQETLFGVVIPYAAIAVFLLGLVYRVLTWARAPVPFKITSSSGQQTSLPWIEAERLDSPPDAKWTVGRMAMEVLFFRSLFRNTKATLHPGPNLVQQSDRLLWLGALVFHWSFLIIFIRHLRFFLEPVPAFVQGMERLDELFQVAVPTLFLTDVAIVAALLYLLGRRFFKEHIGRSDVAGYHEKTGLDRNSFFGDPKLVDPASGDFRLAADSPVTIRNPKGKPVGADHSSRAEK